jgi:uncharacterized protein with HEPN domain
MLPRSPKLLWDIHNAAEWILEWAEGKSVAELLNDDWSRLSVERLLEILGEAARRLRDYDPETADRLDSLNQAIALRNIIAHQYDGIDYERIWEIIQQHLPGLREEALALLDEADM